MQVSIASYNLTNKNNKNLIMVYGYDIVCQEFQDKIQKKMDSIKNMKDTFKKGIYNNRLYSLQTYLNDKKDQTSKLNSIFFINDNVNEFQLTKNEKQIANDWKLKNYWLEIGDDEYDISDKIDYLIDLFTNLDSKLIAEIDKSINFIDFTKNKSKVNSTISYKNEKDLFELLNKPQLVLVHGSVSTLRNIQKLSSSKNYQVYTKKLDRDTLNQEIINLEQNDIHKKLQELFDKLNNPNDSGLVLYGKLEKEITEAINNYQVSKLFITETQLKILKNNIDNELLNFEIIIIKKLKDNDIAAQIESNYDGVLGLLYYAI